MKKLLLTIIAALTLSMSSTYAFRDATTPKYAEDFRKLDPMPTHYKTCLAPIDVKATPKPMVAASNTTELMQPVKTWSAWALQNGQTLWQSGKKAIGLTAHILNPLALATSWATTKTLIKFFQIPGIKNYLGEKTATFVGSVIGLSTAYAFNPLGIPTQALTTLQILLSISFSMEIFERLYTIATAIINHQWKMFGTEFVMECIANVILGLLIFDAFESRTALSNGMAQAKQALLNKLSPTTTEQANAIANNLRTISSKEIGNCMTQSGLGYEQCLQATTNANAQCPALVTPVVIISETERCTLSTGLPTSTCKQMQQLKAPEGQCSLQPDTTTKEIGNCMTQRNLGYEQCLQITTDAKAKCPAREPATTSQCLLQQSTSINPIKQAPAVCPATNSPANTFVQDINKCMQNTGRSAKNCANMASTIQLKGTQCPVGENNPTGQCPKPGNKEVDALRIKIDNFFHDVTKGLQPNA